MKDKLPNEKKYGIDEITNHTDIRKNIRKIQEFLNEGRKRKGTNIWNNEWELGIENFVRGYELGKELHDMLKEYEIAYYNNKYLHDKNSKTRRLTLKLFILGAIITMIIALGFSPAGVKIIERLTSQPQGAVSSNVGESTK